MIALLMEVMMIRVCMNMNLLRRWEREGLLSILVRRLSWSLPWLSGVMLLEGTGADHSIAILVILFVVTLARESSSSRLGVGRSPSKSPTVGMTG